MSSAPNKLTHFRPEQLGELPWKFIARLDHPADGSTAHAEEIELKGWFFLPNGSSLPELADESEIDVSVLIEETSTPQTSLAAGLGFVGYQLKLSDNERALSIETIEFSSGSSEILDPEQVCQGEVFEYCIRVLIHEPGTYRLSVKLEFESQTTITNYVSLHAPPLESLNAPLGGLNWNYERIHCDSILQLDGWAALKEDSVRDITVSVNELLLKELSCCLPSPEEENRLPGLSEAKFAGFSGVLLRESVIQAGIPDSMLQQGIRVKIEVAFTSGKTLDISSPVLRWFPPCDRLLSGTYSRVLIDQDDNLQIEADVLTRSLDLPTVALEWAGGSIDFSDPAYANCLVWESKNADLDVSKVARLRISLPVRFFGNRIGAIRCLLRDADSGSSVVIGPQQFEHLASELVAQAKRTLDVGTSIPQHIFRILPHRKAKVITSNRRSGSRILFASHNLSRVEGAPKVLANVISDVIEHNSVSSEDILVVSGREGDLRNVLEAKGIRVELVPELDVVYQDTERYRSGLVLAQSVFREFQPSLVYANGIDSFWAIDLALRFGISNTFAIHESADPLQSYHYLPANLRCEFIHSLLQVDRCVFVSEATSSVFSAVRGDKADVVIPNGVDLEQIDKVKSQLSRQEARAQLGLGTGLVVSILGTTTERKGQDVFLRGVAEAIQEHSLPIERAFIVGAREGEFLEEITELAASLGIADVVEFVAETPEVEAYIISSDIMVVASREESAPLVSLEAFAYGVPLISTRVFGLAEQIQPGVNALSFECEDSRGLAKCIAELAGNEALGKKLSEGGRRSVIERFNREKMLGAYLDILGTH